MFFFKLKLFLQKSFFRLIMLGALLAFAGVFIYAIDLEKKNVPPSGMRLPGNVEFGTPLVEGELDSDNLLSIQHMGSNEVSQRLTEIIADALSFNKDTYANTAASVKKYFTEEGYAQYMQFLTNSAFESTLAQQNLQAGAYIDEQPIELARGAYNGVFKWVFEVPVTISFIPRNSESYTDNQTTPQNRDFVLRAQFARVDDPQDPNAIKIELWQVLPPRSGE